MSNETARWALYKQYEEVNQNFRTVWQLYLTFYTANLTINVAALAFVSGGTPGESPRLIGWVAFAFVAIDLLVVGSTLFIRNYTRGAVAHAQWVAQDIVDFAAAQGEQIDSAKCFRSTLPAKLCEWVCWANAAGMLLVSAVWIAMALR
jgi:hypothetical protein